MRVLELATLVAGPAAGSLLAAWGADVIKVERPGGEPGRRLGSAPIAGDSHPSFAGANFGKRSVEIDLQTAAGVDRFRHLLGTADIVLDNMRPSAWSRIGLDPRREVEARDELVWVALTGFGGADERPAVDLVVQAESGMMATTGERGGPPLRIGFLAADTAAAYVIAASALAALLGRGSPDTLRYVELSLVQVAMHLQGPTLAHFLATGEEPIRAGRAAPLTAPADAYPTADGWIVISAAQPREWALLCETIGTPELAADSRFADLQDRLIHRDELTKELSAAFNSKCTDQWLEELRATGLMAGRLATYQDVKHQADAGAFGPDPFLTVQTEQNRPMLVVRPPVASAVPLERRSVPRLGQHTEEVLEPLHPIRSSPEPMEGP